MYFDDHAPPHFHVKYNEAEALVGIAPVRLLQGVLPSRVLGLVVEWATLHEPELLANWQQAVNLQPLAKIAPLV